MSTSNQQNRRWTLKSILLLATGALALLLVAVAVLNVRMPPDKTSPLVPLSRETTFVTEPLNDNGDVDYAAYINQFWSEGVTPDNNVMVDLVKAIGAQIHPLSPPPEYFETLGIEATTDLEGPYIPLLRWLLRRDDSNDHLRESIRTSTRHFDDADLCALVSSVPFSTADSAAVGEWLDAMDPVLDSLRVAMKKPRRYSPVVWDCLYIEAAHYSFFTSTIAHGFVVSAMRHLGNGDVTRAIDDYLAIGRLARLQASSGYVFELLNAQSIDALGHGVLQQIVYSDRCGEADLQRLAEMVDALGEPPHFQKHHSVICRCTTLEYLCSAGRDGPVFPQSLTRDDGDADVGFMQTAARSIISWRDAMLVANAHYDRLDQLLEQNPPQGRVARCLDRIRALEEFSRPAQDSQTRPTAVQLIFGGRRFRGQAMGVTTALRMQMLLSKALEQERHARANRYVMSAAIAVERYRLKYQRLPSSLDEVAPEFLDYVPADLWSGRELIYRRDGGHYVLYSIGGNRRDDGGIYWHEVEPKGIDLLSAPRLRSVGEWMTDRASLESDVSH